MQHAFSAVGWRLVSGSGLFVLYISYFHDSFGMCGWVGWVVGCHTSMLTSTPTVLSLGRLLPMFVGGALQIDGVPNWGKLPREEAVQELSGMPEGSFLVRMSQTDDETYSLSVVQDGQVRHIRVIASPAGFCIKYVVGPAYRCMFMLGARWSDRRFCLCVLCIHLGLFAWLVNVWCMVQIPLSTLIGAILPLCP